MIQSYFGNGKGKTTAAIGAAIRCAGCNRKVLFVQFLKNKDSSELNVFEQIKNIDVLFATQRYTLYDNLRKDRTLLLSESYQKLLFEDVKHSINNYQMLILDEILDAVQFGYIDENELIKMISQLSLHMEIILTGHVLTDTIESVSDYISEIKERKHPYHKGMLPREGIEY